MARFWFSNETADVSGYKLLYCNTRNPRTTALTLASTAATEAAQLTVAGSAVKWITKPFAVAVTLSTTQVLQNFWCLESSTGTNAAIAMDLFRYTGGAEDSTAFWPKSDALTEISSVTMDRNIWLTTVGASTAFAIGDRLVAKLYNVSSGASDVIGGAGMHTNFDYDGPNEGKDGDSWFEFNEPVRVNERQPGSGTTSMIAGIGQGYITDALDRINILIKALVIASNSTIQAAQDDLGYERDNK